MSYFEAAFGKILGQAISSDGQAGCICTRQGDFSGFAPHMPRDNAAASARASGPAPRMRTSDVFAGRIRLVARTADDPVRTVLGAFHWDEVGLPVGKPFMVAQWNGGELQFVYPTDEFETSPLTHPKQGW